jgi:hypothetical protein
MIHVSQGLLLHPFCVPEKMVVNKKKAKSKLVFPMEINQSIALNRK